jgi:selenocysteine-specific translation elongation factor
MTETHAVVCVLGGSPASRARVCSFFAKKTHSEGLEMYHRRGAVQTLLNPATHPDKINHMLAAVSVSDACILLTQEGFGWAEGESVIALTHAGVESGVLIASKGGVYSERLSKMIAGTTAQKFRVVEADGENYSRIDVDSFKPKPKKCAGNVVSVDNVFNVKGVGTVALGFVVCGKVAVHDTLRTPSGKEVRIQSIQVMDEDVEEADTGTRVGLAIRGVTEKELGDQFFLANSEFRENIEATILVEKFYRHQIEEGKTYHIALSGQVIPVNVLKHEGERSTLKLGKPIPQIDGAGVLANMNLPPGTLRIMGHINL